MVWPSEFQLPGLDHSNLRLERCPKEYHFQSEQNLATGLSLARELVEEVFLAFQLGVRAVWKKLSKLALQELVKLQDAKNALISYTESTICQNSRNMESG